MARMIFFWDNEWDKVSDIVPTTEHANFPAENTQLRDFNHPWRSLYGAGSTWGKFTITAAVNDRIDFDEGGGELTANLTPATYTADSLFAHLKTIMDAAGGDTYTWEYLESGSDVNKFKVSTDGNVAFPWDSGTNTARSVGDVLGWDVTADDGAAAAHTADYIRIHTHERAKVDLGAATSILAFLCRGHNIQSGATFKRIQGHTADTWGDPDVNETLSQNTKIIGKILSAAQSKQWWRPYYIDRDNADGYIENGRIFLGPGFQPDINFLSKSRVEKKVDPSIIKRSEGGQISTIQLDDYEVWQYIFRVVGSTEKGYFDDMFTAVKKSLPLWICDDPDNFPAETFYCQFVDWEWNPVYEVNDVYDLTLQVEELI